MGQWSGQGMVKGRVLVKGYGKEQREEICKIFFRGVESARSWDFGEILVVSMALYLEGVTSGSIHNGNR